MLCFLDLLLYCHYLLITIILSDLDPFPSSPPFFFYLFFFYFFLIETEKRNEKGNNEKDIEQ